MGKIRRRGLELIVDRHNDCVIDCTTLVPSVAYWPKSGVCGNYTGPKPKAPTYFPHVLSGAFCCLFVFQQLLDNQRLRKPASEHADRSPDLFRSGFLAWRNNTGKHILKLGRINDASSCCANGKPYIGSR